MRDFLRRHQEVKKRMPVDIDYHRVQWQSGKRVTSIFSRITSLLQERGIIGEPENKYWLIHNCDETGSKCIPTKKRCFAPAKEYQQDVKKSLRRDDNHVILHCCFVRLVGGFHPYSSISKMISARSPIQKKRLNNGTALEIRPYCCYQRPCK